MGPARLGCAVSPALTLEQKLAAVQCGDVGSYNFARPRGNDPDTHFQALARQALAVARARGYFCRVEGDPNGVIAGLLVTVSAPDDTAPAAKS